MRRSSSGRGPEQRGSRRGKKAEATAQRALTPAPDKRNQGHGHGEKVVLYGFHAVREALNSKRRKFLAVYATSAAAERLAAELAGAGLAATILSADALAARLPRDAVHQGVILEARPLPPVDLSDLPASGLVLVLDQITDPHNVGAIVRTAAAFAVSGLVTTERHAPDFSGLLAKSASGGLEHVPLITVTNLARAMEELGDLGFWRVGLDSEASTDLRSVQLTRPLALVFGAEGKGLRRLTREKCDIVARIDLPGAIKSLNVSNACAVALTLVEARLAD
jgi:23S rRNA (guanosine2251-2'-O)-methyltransferase